ncbi:hypothetical protein FXF51_56845 [Nonomuraea sp. PA05]|uniref:hypothetical protein n=1 Tax=Nonomuraea sp. PA05 TaxID=2604466 RepID=UPI0011D5338C|nr:hypothetical protein [Nonomuraea sp. PA05]TYB50250.1 hypothetical protein FXF51_56845 [Nonomuraea sp. PA05]
MISSPVSLAMCRRCGQPILSGDSEGVWVRADPTPIDPRQELDAILAGLATYDLHPHGLPRRPYLWRRNSFRIRGERKWQVLQQHRCPPGRHIVPPPSQPTELYIPFAYSTPGDIPPF